MKLELNWRKNPELKNSIIGQTEELPDSKCWFVITKTPHNNFLVSLPGMSVDDHLKKIIIRDPNIAREICQDYLNYNLPAIIRHQINQIKGSNLPSIKSYSYYENYLERFMKQIEQHKIPAR